MAAPFSITPSLGSDFNTITLAADLAAGKVADARIGEQRWGSNGRRYVYAQANGAITASTAVCTVNATTFLATNSGGSYTSPPQTMAVGDRGWFSATSV
jgi:hypothetical protein